MLYEVITGFSDNGVLMQKNKRLWLLDFDFKTIINPQVWHNAYALDYPSGKYDKLHNDIMLKTDLIVVSVDYKRGLIDKTGKVIVEPIYDDIEGLNANVVACELDDNVVLFKLDGTPLINNNTRITSYNVCYTKLLRSIVLTVYFNLTK